MVARLNWNCYAAWFKMLESTSNCSHLNQSDYTITFSFKTSSVPCLSIRPSVICSAYPLRDAGMRMPIPGDMNVNLLEPITQANAHLTLVKDSNVGDWKLALGVTSSKTQVKYPSSYLQLRRLSHSCICPL